MRIKKTDRNDVQGLAQLMRMGWYREVQVKQLSAHGDGKECGDSLSCPKHSKQPKFAANFSGTP